MVHGRGKSGIFSCFEGMEFYNEGVFKDLLVVLILVSIEKSAPSGEKTYLS